MVKSNGSFERGSSGTRREREREKREQVLKV
jgi:hypothetical protein